MHRIPRAIWDACLKVLWKQVCIKGIPCCLGYGEHGGAVLLVKLMVELVETYKKQCSAQQYAGTHHNRDYP